LYRKVFISPNPSLPEGVRWPPLFSAISYHLLSIATDFLFISLSVFSSSFSFSCRRRTNGFCSSFLGIYEWIFCVLQKVQLRIPVTQIESRRG
jgi:hypothetical protein